MATAVTMKWRLQYRRQSTTDQTTYYVEYDADTITVPMLDDLVDQLEKLGHVNIEYGLVIT